MVAVLSAILPDAAFGREVRGMRTDFSGAQNVGHWFHAIDIGHFAEPLEFRKRIDRAIDVMHSARRAPGVDRILVPGEPEAEAEALQRRDGIRYPVALIDELNLLGRSIGVGPVAEIG